MSKDRNKPGMAFWATVVGVGALVAYPLSFGPACWLATCGRWDSPGRTAVLYGYYPVLWFAQVAPSPIAEAVDSYAWWLAADGSSPVLSGGEPAWIYPGPPEGFEG